ncbi:M48 family metalloprotease [Chitinasiproducens palmae]|uniref:Peptidase family M48 n=1 Tax=Chitinasiproducens palmae TaxID=1770053 RepID=A0A1H2PT64_9BURK|nr:M48 family metalloprotease [Chitinasiproducens palmae]SDV50292.1 Peptidase family M48 [Chitinasiproducens palmae]
MTGRSTPCKRGAAASLRAASPLPATTQRPCRRLGLSDPGREAARLPDRPAGRLPMLHRLTRLRKLLACCVALPFATAALAQATPPSAASATEQQLRDGGGDAFRHAMPAADLELQGDATYQRLIGNARASRTLLPANDARVRRSRAILQKLVPYALKWNDRARDWRWDIEVVRSPMIDAIALPGGKFVVYSGIIDKLSLRDDELALLLAHLSAHALREHARGRLASVAQDRVADERISRLFGLVPPVGAQGLRTDRLLGLRYGTADETEADVIGADIASRAGYDPRAAINFWQKVALANRRHPLDFALVHPYTYKRELALRKRLNDMLPLFAKALGYTVQTLPPFPLTTAQRKDRLPARAKAAAAAPATAASS